MALKLTIVSAQRTALGSRASIVFGVGGGSIGRAHDNDWVLQDPQRYLSAHHARIQFRNGTYYLLDTSTNGVFVNDGTVAIGRRNAYPLRNGDRLRFGDYTLTVDIDATGNESAAPEASSIFPVNTHIQKAAGLPITPDIGSSLNVRDLLRPDSSPSTSSRIGPVDAFGQPLTEDTGLLAFDQSGQRTGPTRVLVHSSARREMRAAERATVESPTGLEAFSRGAGITLKQLSPEVQTRLLHLAGLLLREALVGLKGLALTQREMRDQAGIDVGRENPQHIGLTGLPVEDLLQRLLLGHEQHQLDAVQWLRETVASTRRHDQATVQALHAALGEFMARLDPRTLAQSGDRNPRPDDSSGLTARFRTITETPSGKLPHLFAEAFARVFAAHFGSPPGSEP